MLTETVIARLNISYAEKRGTTWYFMCVWTILKPSMHFVFVVRVLDVGVAS